MIAKAFSTDYFNHVKLLKKTNILFFNGCFDILHLGHYKMIQEIKRYAKAHGFTIICGINSDESINKLNKSHPLINNAVIRAKSLEALGVGNVFIFDEETPTALIMSLIPDIIFKGSDYKNKDFHEREFCIKANIQIKYVDLEEGYSTTNIYNKIAEYIKKEIRESI